MNNYKLMVAGMSNEIYLGTMKKNVPFPVMNEKRRVMTDEVIRAVVQHMMALPEGQCYEFPGHGKLIWQTAKEREEIQHED